MKKIEELQSLTFYREKLILPHNKTNRAKGCMFYSMNNSLDALEELLTNQHPVITNLGNIYKTYYYDYTVLPRSIQCPTIKQTVVRIADAKKSRLVRYEEVKTRMEGINTPMVLRPSKNVNVVYDLNPIVELFDTLEKFNRLTLIKQLDAFFNTFYTVVSKTISGYNNNPIIIVNLDEYNTTKNKRSHLLYNILTLMRRSPKVIEKFAGYKMQVLFYTKNGYFMVDTSKDINRQNIATFNKLIKRCKPDITVESDVANVEKEQVQDYIVKKAMTNNLVGEDSPEEIDPDDILDKDSDIVTQVEKKVKNVDQLSEDNDSKSGDIDDDLLSDEKFKEEYAKAMRKKQTGTKSAASLKRDELLRERQASIKVKTKTIGELSAEKRIPPIKKHQVKNNTITNEHLKDMKFSEFDKTYMNEVYEKDIGNMLSCLNNKSIPVNIVNVKVQDTSDTITFKETYTVTLEDENRKRHTLKFNLPKVVDDRFLYVNGSKKTIQNQLFALPVVKIGPDSVQICTNYNKIIINRFGAKLNANFDKFRKLIEGGHITKVSKGQNTEANRPYLTVLEYDQLAALYTKIEIGKSTYVFNIDMLKEELGAKYKDGNLDEIIIGYKTKSKEPIVYKQDGSNDDLITLMVKESENEELWKTYNSFSTGKKFMYTKGTIMAKKIPMVLLVCYFEGLSTVIRKFNDNSVMFVDKKSQDSNNYNYIRFADGYLKYPVGNMAACILFNGLSEVTTAGITIAEMDEKSTYLDLFTELYGSAGVGMADALLNYYDFMIDPITLEILKTLDYPTDIVSLIIFANNLLADNQFTTDIDLHNYRLRRLETISAILYKNIARAYTRFRRTANNPNPAKITMDENAVIKELIALPTVEDYSELSPMVELHKQGTASMKGANGMNMDRAYKEDKRAFHDSMVGIVGMSTDPGPNGGKVRQLVAEPTIINARGFFDLKGRENINQLTDANLMTPIELLTPMTATHDDNNRNAMATKQTCHAVPVEGNCPALVSTGMDQIVHYKTGDSFSVVAKEDGKVLELNEDKELMIVQYKSGKKQAIDLSSHIVKNGGGGFYLENKLSPRMKQGQTFKEDEILAYDKHYYKDLGPMGNRLTMGSLIKVVVASNYATYEDSTFITKNMSENLATNISMPHSVILGNNANVDYMVKVGDNVVIGDDLIRYEASYDDSELNRLLSNVRDDLKESIVTLGKSQVHSHYTGVVSDIQIYCTVETDQLSPSLQKIVKDYQNKVKARKAVLNKHEPETKNDTYRMGIMITKNDGVTKPDEYGKVKGRDVGKGVLIEFYVTYHDELSDGDKLAQFTANKNTIGFQVPRGYEPYSEFRPYEEISGPVAPSAILQRGTPSVVTTGCASKVLIELKRAQYKILTGEDFDEVLKQKQPYMVTDKEPVKESTSELRGISDSEIALLEDVFDLYKDYNNYYRSERSYTEDSIILKLSEEVDMSKMVESFDICETNHNAILQYDNIVAIKPILPNDPIRVKL